MDAMDDNTYRHLRSEFLSNKHRMSTNTLDASWYESNMMPLLNAHYKRMKDNIALDDVEYMLDTEYRKMSALRHRKDYEFVKVDAVVAMTIIKEWYDKKMEELREINGPETVERDRKDRAARRAQTDEIAAKIEAMGEGLHARHSQQDQAMQEVQSWRG